MKVIKYMLTCILAILSFSALCQRTDSAFSLKWRLRTGEILTYKTEMKVIKDTADVSEFFNNAFSKFDSMTKDTQVGKKEAYSWVNQMRKQMNVNNGFVTKLTGKGITINVEIVTKDGDNQIPFDFSKMKFDSSKMPVDTSMNNFAQSAMFMLDNGVKLRGAINEDGSVKSFYLNNEQRNLLGLFFSLPDKPVKVGDSWPLDVHLISETQNFICDSSFRKNSATVTGIEYKNGQHIVTVKYDIQEYISGLSRSPFGHDSLKTIEMDIYKGTARFSIEKGRWISYDCQLSSDISGIAMVQKVTHYTLSE